MKQHLRDLFPILIMYDFSSFHQTRHLNCIIPVYLDLEDKLELLFSIYLGCLGNLIQSHVLNIFHMLVILKLFSAQTSLLNPRLVYFV